MESDSKPSKGEANSLLGFVLAREEGRAGVLGPEKKEWAGDTAVYNKFFHNAVRELGAKTETGVLLDRHTASKEARGALEVLEKSAKRYQEQADPQWRSVLGAASADVRQSVAELATIFRENTYSDIDKLELPPHLQVVDSRAKLDAATRRFTFESEADVRRSMGETPGVWSGGKKFKTFRRREVSPAETPAWHDLGRADVRAILRARQKELYQLLCRYFFEVVSEDLKSQIFNYLSKEQGTPRERGDRLMWEAIKKRVLATAPPPDILGDVLKHLDEVTKLTDFPTIIRKVAAFGDYYPDELNSPFYNSVLYYYVFGAEVVNLLAGADFGSPWDNGRKLAKWVELASDWSTSDAGSGRMEKLNRALTNRPQQPRFAREHLVGLAAPKKASRSKPKLSVSNPAVAVADSRRYIFSGACFNCGQEGHRARACPQPPKGGGSGGGAKVGKGHKQPKGKGRWAASKRQPSKHELVGHPVAARTSQVRVVAGKAKGRTLRRARAQCQLPDGSQGAIGVFCDTGSTATFIAEEAFHFVASGQPLPVQGAGGEFAVQEMGYAIVLSPRGATKIYGWKHTVPAGCSILLSNADMDALQVTLPKSTEVSRAISKLPPFKWNASTPLAGLDVLLALDMAATDEPHLAHWSDTKMKEFLEEHPEPMKAKHFDVEMVDVNDDLPPDDHARLWAILRAHAEVFDTDDIPAANPVFEERFGAVKVLPLLKDDAKPYHMAPPKMKPNHAEYLAQWSERMLGLGLLKECPDSPWAMLLTVVAKADNSPRVCADLRPLNRMMKPFKPGVMDGPGSLRKVSTPMKARWDADVISAFGQCAVDGPSQACFSFWVPKRIAPHKFMWTKMCMTVLPFGWSYSPVVLAKQMEAVFMDLQPATRQHLVWFYDDWSGGVPEDASWEDFFAALEDWLSTIQRHGVKLKASKCRFGYKTGAFYGHDIAEDGANTLTTEFLSGLDAWVEPRDVHQLRGLMGSLNVARDYVDNFAVIAKPLFALLKKEAAFKWTPEHTNAVEEILDILRGGVRRYKPDPRRRLFIVTDASDDGHGAHIFQIERTATTENDRGGGAREGATEPAESVEDLIQKHGPEMVAEMAAKGQFGLVRRTIGFLSKCWSPAMRTRPVFYREAYALLYALQRCRLHALYNEFPVCCIVDHVSLRWITATTKGAVTAFLLEELADMQFELFYRPGTGPSLQVPDSLSRYPMLGPRRWTSNGLRDMYELLAQAMRATLARASSVWVFAGADTPMLKAAVKGDAGQARKFFESSPGAGGEGKLRAPPCELAILVPPADRAPEVCAAVMKEAMAAAILVPTDLIGDIAMEASGKVSAEVRKRMTEATFVGSASSMFLWVVTGCPEVEHAIVAPALALEGGATVDTDQWIGQQEDDLPEGVEVLTNREGLMLAGAPGEIPKIVVPRAARDELIRMIHEDQLGHLGERQTLAEIKRRFIWKGMRADVHRVVEGCEDCNHIKGSRTLAHKAFRGLKYRGPRLQYHMDFKKMPGGNVLGLVDCFSGYVILLPTYSRTYAEVVDALVDGVFLQYGFPVEIRTDAAKEFGASLAAQLRKWGVRVSSTKGFHAQGNAMIERIWGVVKAMLRTSPTLVEWRRQLKMAAFAINTAIKEQYATSPFEVQFGLPALGPVHASSVQLSDVPGPGEEAPTMAELAKLEALIKANMQKCRTAGDAYRRQRAAIANTRGNRKAEVAFEVGSLVMAFRDPVTVQGKHFVAPADFRPKWVGPFVVLERNNTAYKLQAQQDVEGFRKGSIVERTLMNLKPYRVAKPRAEDGSQPRPTLEEQASGSEATTVTVRVPEHWCPGQLIWFEFGGASFEMQVPEGIKPGGAFQAQVPLQLRARAQAKEDEPAAATGGRGGAGDKPAPPPIPRRSRRLASKQRSEFPDSD